MNLPTPGDAIGDWTLEAPLGRGGFATVWRARSGSGRVGALKVLQESSSPFANARSLERSEEHRARLRREARALADLAHPNVVGLIEVVDGACLAMVTELVHGPNLAEWIHGGPYPEPVLTSVFDGILEGVGAAHERGWVHRDLKPANILLESTEPPVARVADFGLALLADATRLTRSGTVLGTPSYMAPEQVRNPADADPRADVFALGAILFEMWCNRPAFMVGDVAGTLQASSAGLYPNPRVLRPDLPETVERAIIGALDPDPRTRIPDCATLRAVLDGATPWASSRPSADTSTLEMDTPRAPEATAPTRWLAVGAVAASVAVAAVLGVASVGGEEPTLAVVPVASSDPAVQTPFERAWEAWHDGHLGEAVVAVDEARARDPERAWPHVLAVLLHAARKEDVEAIGALDQAGATVDADSFATATAAPAVVAALQEDRYGERSDTWVSLAEQHPDELMVQLISCVQLGERPAAGLACGRAEAQGEVPLLDILLAKASLAAGALETADHAVSVVLQRDPDHLEARLLRVDGLLAAGQAEQALSLAEEVVATAPERPEALAARGVAEATLGDLSAAGADFAAATAKAEGAARFAVLLRQARVELSLGQAGKPLARLREASEASESQGRWGDVVRAQTRLGWYAWYLRDAEQLEASREALLRARVVLAEHPEERSALEAHAEYLGGLAAVARGDAAAIAVARRALRATGATWFVGGDVQSLVEVLWAYEDALAGRTDRLVHIAGQWDSCEAQANGGELLMELERYDEAVARLLQAKQSCGATGPDRLFRFVAEQGLAQEAARVGDEPASRKHQAEMARLWPALEPGHPRVKP